MDTDSIFLTLADIFLLLSPEEKEALSDIQPRIDFLDFFAKEKIQPKIKSTIALIENQLNSFLGFLDMKRENIGDSVIVTGKKRYIMNVYDSEGVRYQIPKKKIMGIESVRSSTPPLCRQLIRDTIDFFFTNDNVFLIKIIDKCKKKIFQEKDLSLICFPRGVNGLEKYSDTSKTDAFYTKGTPKHVRGSLVFNKWLKEKKMESKYTSIQEGEKIKFAYLKMPNPFREEDRKSVV